MNPTANAGQTGTSFAITVGAGRRRPQGRRIVLGDRPSVAALGSALRSRKPEPEGWWSQHVWAGDYREEARWESSGVLVADLDFLDAAGKHGLVGPEWRTRFEAVLDLLPASLYHPTPRGTRLAQVLDACVVDAARYRALNLAYAQRLRRVLRLTGLLAGDGEQGGRADGFHVDHAVSSDLARFLFSPNAIVGGTARDADLTVCSEETVDAATVLAWAEEDAIEEEVSP